MSGRLFVFIAFLVVFVIGGQVLIQFAAPEFGYDPIAARTFYCVGYGACLLLWAVGLALKGEE